ncbi:MAG: sugar ABC transporter ATP-binding protein [Devosia sp.]
MQTTAHRTSPSPGAEPRLSIRNVTKTFPGVRAVDSVTFEVLPGEVHALMGENGAGKSTLMHLVAGVYAPDAGDIELDGHSLAGLDERGAAEAGIAMVFQERSLVGALSVAENIFVGRQPANRLGIIKLDTMFADARRVLTELGVDLDPRRRVETLSPGEQQMVEIAKGLSRDLKVLILDEPTSSLTIKEGRQLFDVVRKLAARGISIVYVSHRMAEIFEISDRLTILKDGRVTGVRDTAIVTEREVVALMVGRELSFAPDPRRVPADAPIVLEISNLAAAPVLDASLTLRRGEIVCLAGLLGAGRTETCEAVFGARQVTAGTISIKGRPFRPLSPSDAMAAGISMLPEDRKESGLFLDFAISDNVAAANLQAYTHAGLLSRREMVAVAKEFVGRLRIATPDTERDVRSLSGGNQQKVLLAKWLARKPEILIVDEPTRGVDVGAKADIYRIIRELAADGMAVLVVSSDLPEVLALAHRIVVMAEGRTVGEMDATGATEQAILELASLSTDRHLQGATP